MAGKAFRFSLDHVLALRAHEAQEAERALARALLARRDRESALADAEASLPALADRAPAGSAAPVDFRRYAAAREAALRTREQARRALADAEGREARAREALADARRPEEALQTLRDEEVSTHKRATANAEAAFLDDQATAAYVRQLRSAR